MAKTVRWFLSLQMTIFLLLIFVRGNEDAEDAYKDGRHLVLEYFLPINQAVDVPSWREKRDVEGSGEDPGFSELKETDNSTFVPEGKSVASLTSDEGSGEVDSGSEISEEEKSAATIIGDSEILTTVLSDETTKVPEGSLTSTEMVFDRSEDFDELSTGRMEETTEVESKLANSETTAEGTTLRETTTKPETTVEETAATTVELIKPTTTVDEPTTDEVIKPTPETVLEETTTESLIPVVKPEETTHLSAETSPNVLSTPKFIPQEVVPDATDGLPTTVKLPTTPPPVVEEVFKETKVHRKVEALPGNILQKENLSLAADPLLIANTRLMDSEENIQLSSSEPKRLGAYIVIALILLSFLTLVGYITFRKRLNRKRQEFESNQESNDTEKALLSLSDYKDNSEMEENHLKNNEITPIVMKSNSKINRFEKNTNFSSPKNLNTIANEKNIEKDNVLKSTAENLTQVIIEDSPKDVEEDKNAPGMEKLIVKTRIDQDSIPKKPIIINRSSAGYIPIPQDSS